MGSDGKRRWSQDPINGLRQLTGAEDEDARIDAMWEGEAHIQSTWSAARLKSMYKQMLNVDPPVPPPAGQSWECLSLVPKVGAPATACFDATTHLRVLQTGTHATPQGAVPYTTRYGDWRDEDGLKMPHAEEMTAGPMTLDAKVAEIVFDKKVDAKKMVFPGNKASAKTPASRGKK
jgi:hypothetical protein